MTATSFRPQVLNFPKPAYYHKAITLLQDELTHGKFARHYIFLGPEFTLKNEFIKQLKIHLLRDKTDANYDHVFGSETSLRELFNNASTISMFGGERLLIIENADAIPDLAASRDKKAASENVYGLLEYWLGDTQIPTVTVWLFDGKSLSGRSDNNPGLFPARTNVFKRKYNSAEELHAAQQMLTTNTRIVNFTLFGEAFKKKIHQRFIECGKQVTQEAVDFLEENCGNNLNLLYNEIHKITLYLDKKTNVTLQDIKPIVSFNRSFLAFDLFDALILEDFPRCENLLVKLRESAAGMGEALKTVSILATQFRKLWETKYIQTNERLSNDALAKKMHLMTWSDQFKNLMMLLPKIRTIREMIFISGRIAQLDFIVRARPHQLSAHIFTICNRKFYVYGKSVLKNIARPTAP